MNKDFHRPIYDNKGTSEVSYACLWVSIGLGLGLVLGVRLVLMLATRETRLPPITLHTREAEANELEKRKQ